MTVLSNGRYSVLLDILNWIAICEAKHDLYSICYCINYRVIFLFWHEFAEKDIRKGEASLGIYHLEREIHEN